MPRILLTTTDLQRQTKFLADTTGFILSRNDKAGAHGVRPRLGKVCKSLRAGLFFHFEQHLIDSLAAGVAADDGFPLDSRLRY